MLGHEIYKPDTFLYYSYGSNMFSFRIHMNNPSAEYVSIARLDNYRLDFIRYSKFWGGPTATLVPTANAHVWGVIWRLGIEHVATIDDVAPESAALDDPALVGRRFLSKWLGAAGNKRHNTDFYGDPFRRPARSLSANRQEGVHRKIYYPKHVQVLTPYMANFKCRVYIHKVNPLPRGDNEVIPVERWPSWTYKEILILGAMEHELPEYYIQDLEKIKHNGEKGFLKMYTLLLKFVSEKPCVCDIPKKKRSLKSG